MSTNEVFMCTCREDHGVTLTDAVGITSISGPDPVITLAVSPRAMGRVCLTKKDALKLAMKIIEEAAR